MRRSPSPRRGLIIAIDGPSGTGKSTAAKGLAQRLGYLYLDTGAMYRALALKALRSKMALDNRKALAALAKRSRITFRRGSKGKTRILLDGTDVSGPIRHPKVAQAASVIATVKALRRILVAKQRRIGANGRIVAEGRDTGTVVFPGADLKVYLTASVSARARRRFEELRAAGHRVSLPQVLKETRMRDLRDRRRAHSPLRVAPGALWIDNSRLQSRQVLDKLIDYVRRHFQRGDCIGI